MYNVQTTCNAQTTTIRNSLVRLPILNVSPNAAVMIRRARVSDVPRLYDMINYHAAQGDMLPKTLDTLYNRIREFKVAEIGEEVVACTALKVMWHDLAEVASAVVHPDFRGRSLGRKLIESIIAEARELRIPSIFALTLQVEFFRRVGFRELPKHHLPHKIWQDCDICFKKERCDEVAMIYEVTPCL
jgi:amino-acid N-acetyltransferase